MQETQIFNPFLGQTRKISKFQFRHIVFAAVVGVALMFAALIGYAYYQENLMDPEISQALTKVIGLRGAKVIGETSITDKNGVYSVKPIEIDSTTSSSDTELQGKKEISKVIYLSLANTDPAFVNTFLSVEDGRFYDSTHWGFTLQDLGRAAYERFIKGSKSGGGASTVHMQLVKTLFLTNERTWGRKTKQILGAHLLNSKFDKRTVLELYLNSIFMGPSEGAAIRGFNTAAILFFGKPLNSLNRAEQAKLISMLPKPACLCPEPSPSVCQEKEFWVNKSNERYKIVLKAFLANKTITQDEYNEYLKAQPPFRSNYKETDETGAPYYMALVKKELEDRFPDKELGRFEVHSLVDPNINTVAVKAIRQQLPPLQKSVDGYFRMIEFTGKRSYRVVAQGRPNIEKVFENLPAGVKKDQLALVTSKGKVFARGYDEVKKNLPNMRLRSAVVIIDAEKSKLLTFVGGENFSKSQFNNASNGTRQPGSTIKPFIYWTGLASGEITTSTPFEDKACGLECFPDGHFPKDPWPDNFGAIGHTGVIYNVPEALAKSMNSIMVQFGVTKISHTDDGQIHTVLWETLCKTLPQLGIEIPKNQSIGAAFALGINSVNPKQLADAYSLFVTKSPHFRTSDLWADLRYEGAEVTPPETTHFQPGENEVKAAVIVREMMKGVMRKGTLAGVYSQLKATNPDIADKFIGKTGSSADGWSVIGWPGHVMVTWVGFPLNLDVGTRELLGSKATGPIAVTTLRYAIKHRPDWFEGTWDDPQSFGLTGYIDERGWQHWDFVNNSRAPLQTGVGTEFVKEAPEEDIIGSQDKSGNSSNSEDQKNTEAENYPGPTPSPTPHTRKRSVFGRIVGSIFGDNKDKDTEKPDKKNKNKQKDDN